MMSLDWPIIAGVLVATLILILPVIMRAKRLPMDATARAAAPGEFATLTDGVTHYSWHGPPSGRIIVLVHGLSVPSFVWAGVIPRLTNAGFRVLTYDIFGRGFSDRPRKNQSGVFVARQLAELLGDQMIGQQITLVGYSMGGAVATEFANRHPDKINKLILLATAGFQPAPKGVFRFIRNTPIIGDWILSVFGDAMMRKMIHNEDMTGSEIPDLSDQLIRQTRYRGYARSILSSLRHVLAQPQDQLHRKLAGHGIPSLAIWAEDDETIDVAGSARLNDANPNVKTVIIANAGHAIAYTQSAKAAEPMLAFLAASEQ